MKHPLLLLSLQKREKICRRHGLEWRSERRKRTAAEGCGGRSIPVQLCRACVGLGMPQPQEMSCLLTPADFKLVSVERWITNCSLRI